jgi:predicted GNAT family N-acyltransferase
MTNAFVASLLDTLPAVPMFADRLPADGASAGNYRFAFARTRAEVVDVLRLRHAVFVEELGQGLAANAGLDVDIDRFDPWFHHLVVRHVASGAAVGCYRLQTRAQAEASGRGWYAASEFDLSTLGEAFLDEAVEIGRACVHPQHRNAETLLQLWAGLAEYARHHGKRRLSAAARSPATTSRRRGTPAARSNAGRPSTRRCARSRSRPAAWTCRRNRWREGDVGLPPLLASVPAPWRRRARRAGDRPRFRHDRLPDVDRPRHDGATHRAPFRRAAVDAVTPAPKQTPIAPIRGPGPRAHRAARCRLARGHRRVRRHVGLVALPLLAAPTARRRWRRVCMRWWCRGVLWALGVRLTVRGAIPADARFVVSNHLSYLDVAVLAPCCRSPSSRAPTSRTGR